MDADERRLREVMGLTNRSHSRADGTPKVQYRTEGEAKDVARRAAKRGVMLRCYQCQICNFFHVGNDKGGGT